MDQTNLAEKENTCETRWDDYLKAYYEKPSSFKSWSGYDLKEIKSIIFNPIIIGGILGWASSSFGLDFPLLIDKTAEMIIMMIFPLVLITTGGSIKFGSTSPNEKAFVVGIASKIVVLPLLSYFFLTSMSVTSQKVMVVKG